MVIVVIVGVEFYLTEYRHQRSDISVHSSDYKTSTWRRGVTDLIIEHEFTVRNAGRESGLITSIELREIIYRYDNTELAFDGRASGDFGFLPDGPRIPPGVDGTLLVYTNLQDTLRPDRSENAWLTVRLEISITDQLGDNTTEVTDELDYGP